MHCRGRGKRRDEAGRKKRRRKIFNTAFLVDENGEVKGTYDKVYLLAFGEYLPLGETFPFLYDLSPHTSRFSRGQHTDSLELDGIRYGLLYERLGEIL